MNSVTREDVVAAARRWVGVPYRHQGRNRLGVDCIGLLLVVGWELGLSDYDVTGYGRSPNAGFLRAECDRLLRPTDSRQPGDILLLRFKRDPQHLAFVSERGLIHAWYGAGRVVETALATSWSARVVQAYSIPGVA